MLNKFFKREKKIKLPVWLKLFANNHNFVEEVDKDVLKRMAEALIDKKEVVFLVNSKPYKLKMVDDKVKGEFIKNYKYVLE